MLAAEEYGGGLLSSFDWGTMLIFLVAAAPQERAALGDGLSFIFLRPTLLRRGFMADINADGHMVVVFAFCDYSYRCRRCCLLW